MSQQFQRTQPSGRQVNRSTKVAQQPGGNQSFNLFGGPSQAPPQQQQKPSIRPTNVNQPNQASPFNPQGQAQQQKPSRIVRQNSGTFTPDVNSPFSNAPLPQKQRDSKANNYSAQSPFNQQAPQTPPQQRFARQGSGTVNNSSPAHPLSGQQYTPPPQQVNANRGKANQYGSNSPFNPNAANQPPPQHPQRTPPKANQQTAYSPFTANNQNHSEPQQRSSTRLHHAPGGKQSINLFGAPEPAKPQPAPTPTYAPSQQAPWNPNAGPVESNPHRAPPKANNQSQASPFSGQEYKPAPMVRRDSKVNLPDKNSPFSKAPLPQKATNRGQANKQTAYSPFSGQQEVQLPKQRNAIGVQQNPGGNQSFNVFQTRHAND